MKLDLTSRARKQLKKIPKREQKKIIHKLESLSQDSHSGKALEREYKGMYSLRAWPYRIIYLLKKDKVIVVSIAPRQGIYK